MFGCIAPKILCKISENGEKNAHEAKFTTHQKYFGVFVKEKYGPQYRVVFRQISWHAR